MPAKQLHVYLIRPASKKLKAFHGYDTAQGFVVIAATPKAAREIAQSNAGDERVYDKIWMNPETAKITRLGPALAGCKAGLVLRDFLGA